MGFHSLNDVLQEQLEDMHSAETPLGIADPRLRRQAVAPQ
jgi:hypothetical protein